MRLFVLLVTYLRDVRHRVLGCCHLITWTSFWGSQNPMSDRSKAAVTSLVLTALLLTPFQTAIAQSVIVSGGRSSHPAPSLGNSRKDRSQRRLRSSFAPVEFRPFVLKTVVVDGTTVPVTTLAPAWQRYIGQTVSLAEVNALADAVAALYGRTDVALYTVTVREQAAAGGILRLQAMESSVGEVEVKSEPGVKVVAKVRALAMPLLLERPLKRSSLSALLAKVREIPGVTAEANVSALLPGRVRLELSVHQARMQLSVAANNQGQLGLGRWQGDATLSLNSIITPGDQTQLSILNSLGEGRLHYYAIGESQPFGTATLQGSFGYLTTHVPGAAGTATRASLGLGTSLWQIGDMVVRGTVAVDGINVHNAFIGNTVEQDRTRAGRFKLDYADGAGESSRELSLLFSRGFSGLGSQVASRALSNPAFAKLSFTAGWSREVGGNWVIRLRSQGQYSFSRLPLIEQFSLGGPIAGRAFLGVSAVGDSGIYGLAEAAHQLFGNGRLRPAELYAFADSGYALNRRRLGQVGADQSLSSVGLGARSQLTRQVVLQIEGAEALQQTLPQRAADSRINLALRLTL